MPKILVADDNTNIQKMVALAFEERGIDVISVGNGEAAVRRLPDLQPDMVLADIFMPVRNGYEVCEYVKKDSRFSHIPVILLVGAFDPLDEKEARRVGADGVLKKPFVPPDPLIAMVTTVLEKNPRIAAELAVARNAAIQAAQAPPASSVELPSTVVAKPLPEFPEPTPEESALIYGFGSGRRAPDDAKDAIPSVERPAPLAEVDEEPAEEFDGAATSRDWRRNAMDFEIPEDQAKQPAFASDDNLDAISFPALETEEPRHVPVAPTPSAPPQRVTAPPVQETDEFESAAAFSEFHAQEQEPEPSFLAPEPISQATISEPEVPSAALEIHAHIPEHVEETPAIAAEPTPEPTRPVHAESSRQVQDVPAPAHDAVAEPSFASKVRGWMDAISPSGYEEGGWFASITAAVTGAEKSKSHAGAAHSHSHVSPAVESPAAPTPPSESKSGLAEAPAVESSRSHASPETAFGTEPEAAHLAPEPAAPLTSSVSRFFEDDFSEESFFADEPAVDAHFAEEPPAREPAPAAQAFVSDRESEADVSAESLSEHVSEPIPGPLDDRHIPIAGFGREDFASSIEPAGSYKEPDLVEPPAVQVAPDPLLVDDEPERRSPDYGSIPQQIAAVHDFLAPSAEAPWSERHATDEPFLEVPAAAAPTAEVPLAAAPPAEAPSLHAEQENSPVSAAQETSAWVPVAPEPPSQEDLSRIPFLAPPAEFLSRPEPAPSVSPDTVDAVVQKVLERLEPQLRELLANGLRPLVENILDSESEKNRR